ncbi:D-alanine--D-alanine ligase [Egicoccus sp. AB-alg2]|uniref:D-alanine--D-alanine ligase family protein n=1 Tax=Egicoccus sp. AB-alg2 TaxID=3242693 RepID=UPI00359E21F5
MSTPGVAPASSASRLRVAVLMGGANSERHVSLACGVAVVRALRARGHRVAGVDSAAVPDGWDGRVDGAFHSDPDGPDLATPPVGDGHGAPPDPEMLAVLRARQDGGVLAPELLPLLAAADVVFLTVYGDEGEAGATQRLLDAHGIRYTGPSAEVCALTFDKEATKRVLVDHGISTPAWHRVRRGRESSDLAALALSPPWIVKPVRGGSTIGLSYVTDAGELPAAVARAGAAGEDALVEEYVPGRDLTVGTLGDRVLAAVELVTDRGLYDYEAKYAPGASRKQAPADLTPQQTAEIQRLAGEVHRCLGIGDTSSRSDFRLGPDGRFQFLEVNPLPGITPTSGFAISARAAGLAHAELCEHLLLRALGNRV